MTARSERDESLAFLPPHTMPAPPPSQRTFADPTDPTPNLTPLQAQDLAAHFLWKYQSHGLGRHDQLRPGPPFERPPYISPPDWSGFYSPHTRELGVCTPSGHTLVEKKPQRDTMFCGRSGKDHEEGQIFRADYERKVHARALEDLWEKSDQRLANWTRSKKANRGPRPVEVQKPDERPAIQWEGEALDGEGMDDTFTLQAIAEIVTGRFKGRSPTLSHWSDQFSTFSTAWTPDGPLYILLHPHVQGFMSLYAPFPAIEDALSGRLGLPSWAPAGVGTTECTIG
ncbi:hypothetical protein RQP46_000271 [Phenoliferia psychrophenolica]